MRFVLSVFSLVCAYVNNFCMKCIVKEYTVHNIQLIIKANFPIDC